MKTFIISALSALALAAALNVADLGAAAARTRVCFRGDTMDRDGGHTGALGAPECVADLLPRVVVRVDRSIA